MTEENPQEPFEEHLESESESGPVQAPGAVDIDALNAKIAEAENAANQFKDQLLRKAAEFENYKKRVESENSTLLRFASEELISKLLPLLDDFERSLKAIRASSGEAQAAREQDTAAAQEAILRGVELIYSKFKKVLELQGVKHFEAVGKPFDPQFHDALLQIQRSDVPPHTVIEEVEKGYMLNDRVIRHARVIVSAEPPDHPPADEPTAESGTQPRGGD